MNTKLTKAQKIASVITTVAKYYGVDPMEIYRGCRKHLPKVKDARNIILHHLISCGMTVNSVGRIFELSDSHAKQCATNGMKRMDEDDQLLLKTLPKSF